MLVGLELRETGIRVVPVLTAVPVLRIAERDDQPDALRIRRQIGPLLPLPHPVVDGRGTEREAHQNDVTRSGVSAACSCSDPGRTSNGVRALLIDRQVFCAQNAPLNAVWVVREGWKVPSTANTVAAETDGAYDTTMAAGIAITVVNARRAVPFITSPEDLPCADRRDFV
ncbi:MAG: hypothetical protein WA944_01960 [Mycobacterium sp.]